jgi:GTPase SAR1 family protein
VILNTNLNSNIYYYCYIIIGIDITQLDIASPLGDSRNIRFEINFKFSRLHSTFFSLSLSFRFNLWDFAGQEIYYTTHQIFLSERAVYVLVWDIRLSFEEVMILYITYFIDYYY